MRVLITAALLFLVSCASTAPQPSASVTPPSATAGPTTYTSVAFAYRIELPAGWRYSDCQSGDDFGGPVASHHEGFTAASVDDEASTHVGPTHAVVSLRIFDNPAGRSALQWLSNGGAGFGDTFDRAIVDGREGAQIITAAREVTMLVASARGRIYAITGYGPQGITPDARRIMNSLHVLDDAELANARATTVTPPPTTPRSAESVADTLARGFSQKDTTVLATVAWACLSQGLQQSGASFSSTTRALDDLGRAFAAGVTVTVTPRPVTVQAGGYGSVEATWTDARQTARRAEMTLLKRGDTWYWNGWILGPP